MHRTRPHLSIEIETMAFVSSTAPLRRHRVASIRPTCICACSQRGNGADDDSISRRAVFQAAALTAVSALLPPNAALARPEGVNRPELLPKEVIPVLDLENFLTKREETTLIKQLDDLEAKTGFKLRVLTQRYPLTTPGLAVQGYWGLGEDSVLLVADYFGSGQLLKFNVGDGVDKLLPPRFWSVLSAGLGNKFYVQTNGENGAIIAAVDNIRSCLLKGGCNVPPYLEDKV